MISFHQTISIRRYLSLLRSARNKNALVEVLRRLFPHHATTLTDSGRSALGLAIEALGLEGKAVAMPAHVCNVLLPVLERYRIHPVFLDIDEHTFQPPPAAYTDAVLDRIDGAILVATYGGTIDPAVAALLVEHGKLIIEDFAHCPLPDEPERISGTARYYSFPKMYPVIDGGVAVLPKTAPETALKPNRVDATTIANLLKLVQVSNTLYMAAKRILGPRSSSAAPTWNGARKPSPITERALSAYLSENRTRDWKPKPWQYCLPIRVHNPTQALKALYRHDIAAERLWSDPIIMHPKAASLWGVSKHAFPETVRAAREVVCVPLWHIENEQEFQNYRTELKHILAGNLAE